MEDTNLPEGFQLDEQPVAIATNPVAEDQNIDPYADAPSVPVPEGFQLDEDKYGTTKQQVIAGLEGAGKGLLGPVAPLIETKLLGIKPEDIRGRAEENPITHGVSEGAAFVGSLFTGVGLAPAAVKTSAKALEAVGLGTKAIESAGLMTKIGAEALDQATQAALIQGADEISKRIVQDPAATAENAISNVGLATALGGTMGAGIGAISPLFKAMGNKGSKIFNEIVDEAKWLNDMSSKGITPTQAATKELEDLVVSTETLKDTLHNNNLKGELIRKNLPEAAAPTIETLKSEFERVYQKLDDLAIKAADSVDTAAGAKYIEQRSKDLKADFLNANTVEDAHKAFNKLKQNLDNDIYEGAKANKMSGAPELSQAGKIAQEAAGDVRAMLENESIWGKAGKIQNQFNEAYSTLKASKAENDFIKTFMREKGGEKVIDPARLETFIKQAGNPKAEIKNEILENMIRERQIFADKINKIANSEGLEDIVSHQSMAVLNKLIGKQTEGAKLVQAFANKIGDQTLGSSAAAGIGGLLGGGWGAVIGEKIAGPAFTKALNGITSKIIENPRSITGLKSAIDYATQAVKGETNLNRAVSSVFKGAGVSAVLNMNKPSADERAKLDRLVVKMQENPENLTKVDTGKLSHYMSDHQLSLSETSARAVQYLAQLKPQPYRASPLDKEIQPSEVEMQRYNRALDIAQKPAVILQHVKDGTLQASDMQDLNGMYPALARQMATKLSNEIANMQGAGEHIPYKTRIGLSLFLGQPLDTSMTPSSIQAAQPQAQQQPQQGQAKTKRSTTNLGKTTTKQYLTPDQAAQAAKSNRD